MFRIIKDIFLTLVSFALFFFIIYIFVGEDKIRSIFSLDTIPKAPLFVIGDNFFDFGLISKNGVYKNEFQIKNGSLEDVKITDIISTCSCLSAEIVVDDFKLGPFSKKDVLEKLDDTLNIKISPQKIFLIKTIFAPSVEKDILGKTSHKIIVVYDNGQVVEIFIRGIVGS